MSLDKNNQVARAFLMTWHGSVSADIRFDDRFLEPAIRLVLDHSEIGDVRPWADLMAGSMQGALMAAEQDPSPVDGYLDMATSNMHRQVHQAMKEALKEIRDSKEVAGENRLKASDLLKEIV